VACATPDEEIKKGMSEAIFLTEQGHRELSAELQDLVEVRQPQLAALLAEAQRENTEREEDTLLVQGREELARVEQRIRELQRLLRTATVAKESRPAGQPRVGVGSRVVVRYDGEEVAYTIVTSLEANAATGRISEHSPVGKALLGHQPGDEVVVQTPAGEERLAILSVA
jgi:transcription elongation factor GreA